MGQAMTAAERSGKSLSPGKVAHLKKLSDARGVIRAAAMDQRGSLQKSIAKEKGVPASEVTAAMMEEFKTLVAKVLTPHASAILLDPEFGLPAMKARAPKAGVLLAYEKTGYDQSQEGRIPELLDAWTVRRTVEAGANAVKVLLYYTPFDKPKVNEIKHAMMERIGAECVCHDIPFFLEFVGYDLEGRDEKKDPAFAKLKPELVAKSMAEFSKPRYNVDVLKVEIPVNMQCVEGAKAFGGTKAYSREEAKAIFRHAAEAAAKPFIYLSAGVSDAEFRESLELANEAGVPYSGVLCGRATWKDGIPIYAKQGAKAFEAWLTDRGVANIQALNKVLDQGARPWSDRLATA